MKISKEQSKDFSEGWQVKFWIQNGEFWQQKTEKYYTRIKWMSENVKEFWQKEYKDKNVKFISINYE